MGIDAPTGSLHTTDETVVEPETAASSTAVTETEPASIALVARDLDVYYGEDRALRSIDMEIPEGELYFDVENVYDEDVDPEKIFENPNHDRVEDDITGTFI